MADENENRTVFVENLYAPDIFADSATGFHEIGGLVRITLEVSRTDFGTEGHPVRRVCIGRLTMPHAAAVRMASGVLEYLARVRALTSVAASEQEAESPTVN